MELATKILSDITVHMKYAKYIPAQNRRESWDELVNRNMYLHIKKYPDLASEIVNVYEDFVRPKKALPSMRSMQFAGKPIEVAPNRVYNCAYLPIDHPAAFSRQCFFFLVVPVWDTLCKLTMLRNFLRFDDQMESAHVAFLLGTQLKGGLMP